MRWVSVRVLPVPGPATISSGPPGAEAATRCIASSRSSRPVPTSSMPASIGSHGSCGEGGGAIGGGGGGWRPLRLGLRRRRAPGLSASAPAPRAGAARARVRRTASPRRRAAGPPSSPGRRGGSRRTRRRSRAARRTSPAAQPGDRLAEQLAAGAGRSRPAGRAVRIVQLRAERGDQRRRACPRPSCSRRRPRGSRRGSRCSWTRWVTARACAGPVPRPAGRPAPRPGAARPRSAACRTPGSVPPAARVRAGSQLTPQAPVPVGVVLALLREELERPGQPVAGRAAPRRTAK